MPLPEIHLYVWFIEKTESSGAYTPGAAVRTREPEIATESFQIPTSALMDLSISDGISETDDTVNAVLTREAMPFFDRIRQTEHYPVMGMTVDNRLFGPYDLESPEYREESNEIILSGRIDREFEDTVIDRFYEDLFSPVSYKESALAKLIANTIPYNSWDYDGSFLSLIIGSIGQAKDLAGIRGALNPYGIGISPRTVPHILSRDIPYIVPPVSDPGVVTPGSAPLATPQPTATARFALPFSALGQFTYRDRRADVGKTFFLRRLELYPKYPTTINGVPPERQTVEWWEAGFDEGALNSAVSRTANKLAIIRDEDILIDPAPSFKVPDANNAPGSYRYRRIDLAVKGLNNSYRILTRGTQLPRLLLDPANQNTVSATYIDNARWQLQNSAANGSLTIKGDIRIISGQYIQINEKFLQYPYWRVDSVQHRISPNDGYVTTLGLVLVQGAYSVDPTCPAFDYDVASIEVVAGSVPNPQEIPERSSGNSWWSDILGGVPGGFRFGD